MLPQITKHNLQLKYSINVKTQLHKKAICHPLTLKIQREKNCNIFINRIMLVENVMKEKLSITFHSCTQYHDEQLQNNNNKQLCLPVFSSIYFRWTLSLMSMLVNYIVWKGIWNCTCYILGWPYICTAFTVWIHFSCTFEELVFTTLERKMFSIFFAPHS